MKTFLVKLLTLILVISTALFIGTACKNSGGNSNHVHEYEKTVVSATCTEQGYTINKCSCGEEYTSDVVSPLGHSFQVYKSDNNATCTENGTKTAKCERAGCNESDTITDKNSKLGHDFKNYISNGDATTEADGTKTAKCERAGCNESDTITDVGSKIQASGLTFKTLTVEDTNVTGIVSNATSKFDFNNEIITNENYIVALSSNGTNQVLTKEVDLVAGDNVVYVFLMKGYNIDKIYTVTIRRLPNYIVSFNTGISGVTIPSQTVEEGSLAVKPDDLSVSGYEFLGYDFDFNTPITQNVTINALCTANTNTPYKVEYYLENLEDNNYTKVETVNKQGTTDTTANAEIKLFTGFTAETSEVKGNINGNGSTVLKVYYQRNEYNITLAPLNNKGTVSGFTNGKYKYGKEFTVSVTVNAGYTYLGLFNDKEELSKNLTYTFTVDKALTIVGKWEANTNTPYVVEYYLENLDNDNYTKAETANKQGVTDTTAYAKIKSFTGFTAENSYVYGNINGNGSTVLKVYYQRNEYTVTLNNSKGGSITGAGKYKYGKQVTLTATAPNLGYDFIGWYNSNTLLSSDLEYKVTIDKDIIAKYTVKAEMVNFNFTSTATTCEITSVKDKTVTEIIVPNYVTSIRSGAFSGCSKLQSITLPFVGVKADVTSSVTYQYLFGYIFGTSSYTGSTATEQKDYGYSKTYYIPTSLKEVTVTGGNILREAFSNCDSLTSIEIPNSVKSIGYAAFEDCDNLTSIAIPNSVTSIGSTAFWSCDSLTNVTLGNSVTSIGEYAFSNCDSLTSIEIPNSVTSIGDRAFYHCTSLTSITVDSSNTAYKSIDGVLYSKDGTELIYYPAGKTNTSFTIPNSVTSIGDNAFEYCSSLTSIEIPNSVTSIDRSVFCDCYNLNTITYNGTKSEWNSISKGHWWADDVKATYVTCTDGNVEI